MAKKGGRAARRKKLQNPVEAAASESAKASKSSSQRGLLKALAQPRFLSTLCFATAGFFIGLVTGLNHFPPLDEAAVIPKMLLLAAYLGNPHPDIVGGLITGFTGLAIGGCLGFSALSDPKVLGTSLMLSSVLASLAIVATGHVAAIGLAFLIGHIPVFLAYVRAATP